MPGGLLEPKLKYVARAQKCRILVENRSFATTFKMACFPKRTWDLSPAGVWENSVSFLISSDKARNVHHAIHCQATGWKNATSASGGRDTFLGGD